MKTKTWIEISRSALRENFRAIRDMVAPAEVLCVIKANAYGHGLAEVASTLAEAGAKRFAVDSLEEGEWLRTLVGPEVMILVLGYAPLVELKRLINANLSFTVFNKEILGAIHAIFSSTKEGTARLHLPIETGLNREGFVIDDLAQVFAEIRTLQELFPGRVTVEGAQMHFADVEDTDESSYAETQLTRFDAALRLMREQGMEPGLTHAASSAASLLYSKSRFDLVRPGIALYGLWPSSKTREQLKQKGSGLELTPALSWKTLVAQIRAVPTGQPIGYGLTEVAKRNSRIAVIPIGYYDGFDRKLSGRAHVLIRGKRCKVMGRVCMNMAMVDVTDVPDIALEDEVVLIGRQGDAFVTADEIADLVGTLNYEIVVRLGEHIPRVLVE